ncbi:DMT family transporter [Rhodovibrionaceae bacterium A322]
MQKPPSPLSSSTCPLSKGASDGLTPSLQAQSPLVSDAPEGGQAALSASLQAAVAAGLYLFGWALFTLMPSLTKLAGDGIPSAQSGFLRYFGGLLVVLILRQQISHLLAGSDRRSQNSEAGQGRGPAPLWLHLVRASMGVGSVVLMFYSASLMPLGASRAMGSTTPIFTVLLAIFFLRERVSPKGWLLIFGAMAGALIILSPWQMAPGSDSQNYLLGALAALGSAFCMAAEGNLLKHLSGRDPGQRIVFLVNLLASALLLLPAVLSWQSLSQEQWWLLALLGPIAILGQLCSVVSLRLAPLSQLAPLTYVSLIYASFYGFLFFGEVPGPETLVGALLIVFCSYQLSRQKS